MWKLADWLIDKLEPFMQLLEQLGWKETLKNWFKKASSWVVLMMASGLGAIYTAWLWAWSFVPVWAAPAVWFVLSAMALTILIGIAQLVIRLVDRYVSTKMKLEFDPKEFRKLGEEMVQLHRAMRRSITDLSRNNPLKDRVPSVDEAQNYRQFQESVRHSELIASQFNEMYAAKICHKLILCNKLGIPTPRTMGVISSYELSGIANYIGTIGELLAHGHLDDARKIPRDIIWRIHN